MEKAYDLKELGKRLKDAGLIEAEDMAESAYSEVKKWLNDSAILSANPYDNMAVAFLSQLDSIILPKIDKIDGQEG